MVFVVLAASRTAHSQIISTYAGGVVVEDQPATTTPLSQPRGLAVDRQGNLYITETGAGLIRKVDAVTGVAIIIAGGGTLLDDARPIPARQALLDSPNSPVVDPFGNVFFSDTNNHRVRKITPDGMITTVAGTGIQGGGGVGDGGPATRAQLNYPLGLYLDSVGNLLIGEIGRGDQGRVRMVTAATGIIQTIAGGGTGGEGSRALEYRLNAVGGVTQDRQGNILLVANSGSGDGRVLRIDRASSIVTTVVGGGTTFNPPLPAAPRSLQLCGTTFVAVDSAGTVYFDGCGGVQKLDPSDNLVKNFFNGSGWGGQVVLDSSDTVFAATVGGLVYRIEREQTGRVVAGTEDPFDGLFANLAALGIPFRVAFDGQGNLYIADNSQSLGRIRRVDRRTGIITTVESGNVQGLAVDRAGNAYFASFNSGIRKFEAETGRLTTLLAPAGSPEGIRLAEGMRAADARVYGSSGLAVDATGNLYFITTGPPGTTITPSPVYERIWMLEASSGLLRVVAGNGTRATTGDGGPARDASLGNPIDIALDGRGNLLIVTFAPRLRQVNLATGIITSIPVDLFDQYGVTVDGQGNIYVSQGGRSQVGVIVGGRFIIVAGSGQRGFFGDGGLATLARLNEPAGLAVDPEGNLYIADSLNSRVRKVSAVSVTPVLAVSANRLEFTARQGQLPPSPQRVSITGGNLVPSAWNAEITTQTGGNWLAVSPPSGTTPASLQVGVNPANLIPGLYQGAVNIISPGASGSPQTIAVTLNVQSTSPPVIGLSQQFFNFTALQGGASPPAQSVSLTNTGGGTLSFTMQTEISGGGAWLEVSTSSPTAPATLTVRANSTNLAAGQYQGLITIRETTTGEIRTLAISLLVSRAVPILQVSQTGLLFLGVEGSLTIRPQSLTIQNRGQGVMNWRVTTSVPGGGDWLRATPESGSSDAANPQAAPTVTVSVDPTGLRAGVSTGLLIITAEGAPNSPFLVLVFVSMLAAGTEPVGLIQPAGLIFTAPAGATVPLTQEVTVSSTGGRQLQFIAGVRTQSAGNWLSLTPTSGTLLGSTDSVALQVTASPSGLAAGVYFGALTVAFGSGLVQEVAIALVVASGTAAALSRSDIESQRGDWAAADGCPPTRLVMVETRLIQNFQSSVGWPTVLVTQVKDNCGRNIADATVLASFSSGDRALGLTNLGNGSYSGTWVPSTPQAAVTVTLDAIHATLGAATVRLSGALTPALTPLVFRNGAVNGASFQAFAPLSPGMLFSIFGNNLERTPLGAAQLPLPHQLGEISVKLGEREVPLLFAGPGQIYAQVPYELPTGTTASLVVKKGEVFTTPEMVTIAPVQPAIFTLEGTGSGPGAVLNQDSSPNSASKAAARGSLVQIFATGLGPTNPPVPSGSPAPSPPAVVTNEVTATIGGLNAPVQFAGLAPGFVGLYQVKVAIPASVMPGPEVPLVLLQSGVASNTVTLAIH